MTLLSTNVILFLNYSKFCQIFFQALKTGTQQNQVWHLNKIDARTQRIITTIM